MCELTDAQTFFLGTSIIVGTGFLFLIVCIDKVNNAVKKTLKPKSNIDNILKDMGLE